MRKGLIALVFLAIVCGGISLWLTRPGPYDARPLASLKGDPEAGALVFAAAGCGSCHGAQTEDPQAAPILSGGYHIKSPFGTFVAPNISPGPAGLEGWSVADFGRAVQTGVSPSGQHYFPAFPYSAYRHMAAQDVVDMWNYLISLPVSQTPSESHQVGFPFNIRRGVGAWKLLLPQDWYLTDVTDPQIVRGRYLVEAVGHCAECHTPRGITGHLDRSAWMKGAPNPSGKGTIPSIHPSDLRWSTNDISYYLETGFTPDYDSVGGAMADVVNGISKLPQEDRAAIAAYLKALPIPE